MKTKRLFALFLALLLLAAPAAQAAMIDVETNDDAIIVQRDMEHLVVANPTRLAGAFFSDLWGAATSDIDVRDLVHGYNLVGWAGENGQFATDPSVVSGTAVMENAQGDRLYMLVLYDDLYFSDGTRITAWDYAFSFLFHCALQVNDLGGVTDRRDYLLGNHAYAVRTAPLKNTELVRDARDLLVEKVVMVRDGEALKPFADVIGDAQSVSLYRNDEGELATEQFSENDLTVTADREGVIADWHYEGGVRVFADGTHPVLSGVQVVADDIITITVDHNYLPFFYEMGLLSCTPFPIYAIAPGVVVRDDGEGVYLANEDAAIDEPVFTEELLRSTILDPESGFLYLPNIGSGPYVIKSFDGTTAEFELNPWYKGDADGRLPLVQRLTYTLADNETMVEKLATGEYDVLNKVTKSTTINEAMMLMRGGDYLTEDGQRYVNEGGFRMSNYPRTGLSYVSFACERPTVSSMAVRQAIAWCMDRDKMVRDYTAGNGLRADGYYGLGQWMFGIVGGTVPAPVPLPDDPNDMAAQAAYDEEVAKWGELNLDGLTPYAVDLDQARALLDGDGWTINADGLREKDGVVLDLTLVYPAGNEMARSFEENVIPNLAEVGIRLTLEPLPMTELLLAYYRLPEDNVYQGDEAADTTFDEETRMRSVDMFYLGSNFDLVFDPSTHFMVENGTHNWAYTNCADEELYELAVDMRRTEPDAVFEYVQKWIAFQERFNETLPMIPIYINVYFDFYIGELHDYDIDERITWSQAILGASLYVEENTEEKTAEAGGMGFGDDDFEIID